MWRILPVDDCCVPEGVGLAAVIVSIAQSVQLSDLDACSEPRSFCRYSFAYIVRDFGECA